MAVDAATHAADGEKSKRLRHELIKWRCAEITNY